MVERGAPTSEAWVRFLHPVPSSAGQQPKLVFKSGNHGIQYPPRGAAAYKNGSARMSENEWDETSETGGIAALRKAHKNQAKEIKELKASLAGTVARERTFSVNEALASRGLDPRVAKFYPGDQATDEESVDRWVDENRELFGGRKITDEESKIQQTSLTDSEMRGYEVQKDISAFNNALQMDLKSRLDAIPFDKSDPEAASKELMRVLREFEGTMPKL